MNKSQYLISRFFISAQSILIAAALIAVLGVMSWFVFGRFE